MNKIERYYHHLHALAFSEVPRKDWPFITKVYWKYLVIFTWFHQGLRYNNWQNPFK